MESSRPQHAPGNPAPLAAVLLRKGYLSTVHIDALPSESADPLAGTDGAGEAPFCERLLAGGVATGGQVEDARGLQARLAALGFPVHVGDILIGRGVLSEAQARDALQPPRREPAMVEPTVVRSEMAPSRRPTRALSAPEQGGTPFGRYRLLKELGRGGMGVVYKAWDPDLNRAVALKMLLSESAEPEDVERFLREARAVARLRHPGVVPVHDVGTWEGRNYFTMGYIQGQNLETARLKLPLRRFLEVLHEVACALHAAHLSGVVHRDVKPANILLDGAGKAFVTDFGLVKEIRRGGPRLTVSGVVMGTPHYMSPEQAEGRSGAISPRSDVWSLGVMLYEHLAGRPPFEGAGLFEILEAIGKKDPDPPSRVAARRRGGPPVHRDIETICMKCIEKRPSRRFASAREVAEDLRRFLDGEPIRARPPGAVERARRWLHGNPRFLAASACIVVAAATLFMVRTREEGLQAELESLRARLAATTDPALRREIEQRIAERTGESPAPAAATQDPPPTPPEETDPLVFDSPTAAAHGSAWPAVESKVRALAAGRKFGEALAELDRFLPTGDGDRQSADAARKRVMEDAESAFAAIDQEARRLAAEGRYGEALRAYEPVDGFGVAALSERARKAADGIESSARDASRAAAVPALRMLSERVVALCLDRQYEDAAGQVENARADLPTAAAEIDALALVVQEVRAFDGWVRRGAEDSPGQTVETHMGRGEIRDAGESGLVVWIPTSKAELSVAYASLDASVAIRLARTGGAGREALGLHWLFAGKREEARREWAASARRADLDALVGIVEAVALRREAEEALSSLRRSAEKKDWRKCREILARRERYDATPSWTEAASQIDAIVEQSAEVLEDPLYAVRPKTIGSALEWTYDFSSEAQLRDWRVYPECLWVDPVTSRPTGFGLRHGPKGCLARNARVEFLAALEGECRLAVDVTPSEPGQMPVLRLYLGGYVWEWREGAEIVLFTPSWVRVAAAAAPRIDKGRTVRLELLLGAKGIRALVDGKEQIRADVTEAAQRCAPVVASTSNTAFLLGRVAVRGTPCPAWLTAERRRRGLLGEVGKRYALGAEEALWDGGAIEKFQTDGPAKWTATDGALRAVPGGGPEEYAQLVGPEYRNFRLRFRYLTEDTRYVELSLRLGAVPVNFYLPVDRPGTWRDVEVVAAEDAVRCVLDGGLQLRGHAVPDVGRRGALRITVRDGPLSLREMRVQEIRDVPRLREWTTLIEAGTVKGVSLGKGWTAQDGSPRGTGEAATSDAYGDVEAILRIDGPADASIRLSMRGAQIASCRLPTDGLHAIHVIAKEGSFEVTMDDAPIAHGALKGGEGPIEVDVGTKVVTIVAFRVRPPE